MWIVRASQVFHLCGFWACMASFNTVSFPCSSFSSSPFTSFLPFHWFQQHPLFSAPLSFLSLPSAFFANHLFLLLFSFPFTNFLPTFLPSHFGLFPSSFPLSLLSSQVFASSCWSLSSSWPFLSFQILVFIFTFV